MPGTMQRVPDADIQKYLDAGGRARVYTDAAKRAADIINSALVFMPGAAGKWVAIRLSDGGWDGTVYDTKRDAVRHQLDEFWCCYVRIPPPGTSPAEMQAFLDYNRALYDAGFRLPDPDDRDGGRDIVLPLQKEDLRHQMRLLRAGKV